VLIADGRRASTSTRYSWRVVRGSARGRQFSGTFDCYDAATCPASELPAAASCTTTISSGLQTALNNATGGQVICLSSGSSYGNVSLSSKSYASDVIVQPASGVRATIGSITLTSVQHLHFTGNGGGGSNLTVGKTVVNTGTYLTWDYMSFSTLGCFELHGGSTTTHILLNHTRHDNIDKDVAGCLDDGRVLDRDNGSSNYPSPGWFVVKNSHFGGGGCSDGVQLEGVNETIGPGNEFANLMQGSCGPHVDPLSFDGGTDAQVIGNYFHNNTTGISNYDSNVPYVIRNNVVIGPFDCGCAGIMISGGNGNQGTHNTVVWGGANMSIGVGATHTQCVTNALVVGNILDGGNGDNSCGASNIWNYNINAPAGVSGTGNITATPTYISTPSSGYYHYQLASSSPGYNALPDGTPMGICSTCG
jgi:hypothetical protein